MSRRPKRRTRSSGGKFNIRRPWHSIKKGIGKRLSASSKHAWRKYYDDHSKLQQNPEIAQAAPAAVTVEPVDNRSKEYREKERQIQHYQTMIPRWQSEIERFGDHKTGMTRQSYIDAAEQSIKTLRKEMDDEELGPGMAGGKRRRIKNKRSRKRSNSRKTRRSRR